MADGDGRRSIREREMVQEAEGEHIHIVLG